MALIKCPECGGQVSDRAAACPHCGFPVQANDAAIEFSSDDTSYDVVLPCVVDFEHRVPLALALESKTDMSYTLAMELIEIAPVTLQRYASAEEAALIQETVMSVGVPVKIVESDSEYQTKDASAIQPIKKENIARCPKCGSTSIQAIQSRFDLDRAAVAGFVFGATVGAAVGFAGTGKISRVCLNCKHKW